MKEYVIEGHDGSAKTPVANGVRDLLNKQGLRIEVYAPFQIANSKVPEGEIYHYWKDIPSSKRAIEILSQVISDIRQEGRNKNLDVLLYDRHWMTIMGEIHDKPELVNLWTDFLPTFFLEAPVDKTMNCSRFSFDVPWTTSRDQVAYLYQRKMEIANRFSQHIAGRYLVESREQSLQPIIASITDYILEHR